MTLIIFICVFLVLLLIGMPIAWSMLVSTLVWMIIGNEMVFIQIIPDKIYQGMDVYLLMSVPLFILIGELLDSGKVTDKLVELADQLLGWIRGGLAQVNIGSSILFSGITGVALGDVAALGKVFIPAMVKQGYRPEYAAAVTASSAIIGPMVPPSLIIIIYGAATGVSIGALFSACLIPGLLLGMAQMLLVLKQAKRKDINVDKKIRTMRTISRASSAALIPLMIPVIILAGIMGGIMSPTEAGAIAAVYALGITMFYYRTIDRTQLFGVFSRTMSFSAKLLIIIGCGSVFSLVLAIEEVPELILGIIESLDLAPVAVLLIANLILLVIGMFIDPAAAIILFAPILSKIVTAVGIDPLHFGVIMILNLNLGLLTPPLGICLFAAEEIADCGLAALIKETIPFLLSGFIALMLVSYLPQICLFLPDFLGY